MTLLSLPIEKAWLDSDLQASSIDFLNYYCGCPSMPELSLEMEPVLDPEDINSGGHY